MSGAPRVAVGGIVVDRATDTLLLIRRGRPPGQGLWSLPGGRVEADELLAEAVVREVREETAIEVVCGPLIGWVERIDDEHHYVILDFEATPLDPQPPVAGDDVTEAAWVPITAVAELHLVEGLAEFLADNGVIETIV